jgi:hypothetical protein
MVVNIDPLHMTSRGARNGPPWRTTGTVFYGENVQRLPLPLVCKEGKLPFFSWLQYVRLTIACFHIDGWRACTTIELYQHLALASTTLHRRLSSNMAAVGGQFTEFWFFLYVQWVYSAYKVPHAGASILITEMESEIDSTLIVTTFDASTISTVQ